MKRILMCALTAMAILIPNNVYALTKTVLPPNYRVIRAWFDDGYRQGSCDNLVVFVKVEGTNEYHLIRYYRYNGGQHVQDDAMIIEQ